MAKTKKPDLDKLRVKKLLETVDFFHPVNIKKVGITTFTKVQLLILIKELNGEMIDSTDNWEGG